MADTEKARLKVAAERQIKALDDGWVPQGVRIAEPEHGADAVVLTFTPAEQKALVPVLKKMIRARI